MWVRFVAPTRTTIATSWHLQKGGRKNVRDTGLRDVSDAEVSRRARDTSLPKAERERYKTEEKARGLRHRGSSIFSTTPTTRGVHLEQQGVPITTTQGASPDYRGAAAGVGIGAPLVGVWWAAKWLSPACGPALPVCAVVL